MVEHSLLRRSSHADRRCGAALAWMAARFDYAR